MALAAAVRRVGAASMLWLAGWALVQALSQPSAPAAAAALPASPSWPGPAVLAARPAGPAVAAAPAPGAAPEAAAPPLPTPVQPPAMGRIEVPAAGVDAEIERVTLDRTGAMAVPSTPGRVGWYGAGSAPGGEGDAVFDGHLDSPAGTAVFGRLSVLRAGDRITVQWSGERFTYIVDSIATYPVDAHPTGLFASSGAPRLSLITCAGAWDWRRQTYERRLVVSARLA